MAYRRVDADRHGDRNSDEEAGESEFESRRQPLGDEFDYWLAELERAAEVAAHGTREEIPILDQQWFIESELGTQFRDVFRCRVVTEHQGDRISRRNMHQKKN